MCRFFLLPHVKLFYPSNKITRSRTHARKEIVQNNQNTYYDTNKNTKKGLTRFALAPYCLYYNICLLWYYVTNKNEKGISHVYHIGNVIITYESIIIIKMTLTFINTCRWMRLPDRAHCTNAPILSQFMMDRLNVRS